MVPHSTGKSDLPADSARSKSDRSWVRIRSPTASPPATTLRHFDQLDDPAEAEELIWDGLGLTSTVAVPHVDNAEFGEGCRAAGDLLEREGFTIQRITDAQALIIDGDVQRIVPRDDP